MRKRVWASFMALSLVAVFAHDTYLSFERLCTIHECAAAVHMVLDEEVSNQFVASIPNGYVINEGGIATSDDMVLDDTQTYGHDQHGLLAGKVPDKREIFHGRLAIISSPGQENWYHWLFCIV